MHIDLTRGRPICCSKCGSTNAVRPINNRTIEIQCLDCGHSKLTREAEQRQHDLKYGRTKRERIREDDKNPTF